MILPHMNRHLTRLWSLWTGLFLSASLTLSAAPLELRKGDHIVLVGSALADRMQHSGHFETLLHAHHPGLDLVVRNLAAAGDEVVIRHRSENFGSPDDWLKRTGATVILGFFGANESARGPAAVESFKSELTTWVRHVRS
jgi:hypothetical protein